MKEVIWKLFASLVLLTICLFPTWIWLAVYQLLDPSDLLEKTLLLGIGLWFGGAFQLILLVAFALLTFKIWLDE